MTLPRPDQSSPLCASIRRAGLGPRPWAAIARDHNVSADFVTRVLLDAWQWRHTTCRECNRPIHHRSHIDFPRTYGRCYRCAAAEWHRRRQEAA